MTTTAAKNTVFTILCAFVLGAFAPGCGDESEAVPDGGPTLATVDDSEGTGAAPSVFPVPVSDAGIACPCSVPAGKFGKICVPCK